MKDFLGLRDLFNNKEGGSENNDRMYKFIVLVTVAVILVCLLFIILWVTGVLGGRNGNDSDNKKPVSSSSPTATAEENNTETNPEATPTASPDNTPAQNTEKPVSTPTPIPAKPILESAETEINSDVSADIFINSEYTGTITNVYFLSVPNVTKFGSKKCKISATVDGVVREYDVTVTVQDTIPPVIKGVGNRSTYVNNKMSVLTGITATDNSGEHIDVVADTSELIISETGVYKVKYIAEDSSGNRAEESCYFTVTPDPGTATAKMTYELADEILRKIMGKNMTEAEKCRAIYRYIRNNMGYLDGHLYDNEIKCAYFGLTQYYGDNFVYYSCAMILLKQAGIENMRITSADGKNFWNLVKVDGVWYHFDTTPRTGAPDLCLVTDDVLQAYSEKHENIYEFDGTFYPERAESKTDTDI